MATGQSESGINLSSLFSREAPDCVKLVGLKGPLLSQLKVDTMVALGI